MDPITLSLLMAGGQALMPAIKSMKQGQTLKNLPDVSRPDFEIPEAAQEQLGLARSIASNRNMPGYNEALDKIENQTNRAIGDVKAAGGNMQDVMAAMAAANMQAGMQKRDLDIANDRNYLSSLQNLQGQLGQYANWQNAQQQDQMKAYNDDMARRAALDTARQQNMQNAIGSVAQGAASGIGYQMNMDLMNKMYPSTTTPPVPPVQDSTMEKMVGKDMSILPNPSAPVDIQPQLQNMGPIAGQQVDNTLVNQIQSSLQGQMGSDYASTSGVNTPASGAVQLMSPMQATPLAMPNAGMNLTPQLQPTSSIIPQNQTPFNMLTPDQQQKKILELMMLSGVIK
jgi:hypothetical protein